MVTAGLRRAGAQWGCLAEHVPEDAGAERIVYRADQEADGVLELYLSVESRALRRFPGPIEVR